jgi:hypothetical protein
MAVSFKVVKAEVTASTPKAQKALQQLQAKAEGTLEGELKVKLSPTKVKAKSEAEAMAEELITLHDKLSQADAFSMFKRYDELKKSLQAAANESGAPKDKPFVFSTELGTVTFKECRVETVITDKLGAIKLLGQSVFNEVAKLGVTDAKKYLSATELGKVSEQTFGSRTLQSVTVKK